MRSNAIVPRYLQEKIDQELESGERIEWMDMPVPRFFSAASTGAFLFAIPWTAFAIFWTAAAFWGVRQDESGSKWVYLFPLWGIPFILVGLGMLSSPLRHYRKALKTVYVITDRRAIICSGGRTITIRSYGPMDLTSLYRTEKRDGTGDVIFDRQTRIDSERKSRVEDLGFLCIQNPKEIEGMLKELAGRYPAVE